jgi:SAM-dependent methyltransferase
VSAGGPDPGDGALTAPAVARNREAILAVLRRVLPRAGTVLEVASGSGEHAVFFAAALPHLRWLPSDPSPAARRSVAAHASAHGLPNLLAPLDLDAASPTWPADAADAILCINMLHIAPWAATEGLMAGASRLLPAGGPLVLYGPYREGGRHTAPSNAAFDADLRARDPAWGVRDLEAVTREAAANGLHLDERVAMPANNLCLVYRRAPPA